ncbi:ras association domain-containing protein 7b isoform X2 [Pseudorasbora parva]|uniref:ras association domain-containing protein 7b isoform X2 n=1 Tax=Pseudorasbora parva TaxID=51549 RepID=UPI00351E7412
MELKVWVDGIPRVVCGLSEDTSCQDVVIALAQAIGQTGRYVLIQKLRDKERQLVANERPLESLAKLGQLGNEVQFILRRTGPTSSEASDQSQAPQLPRLPEPVPLKHKEPKKALTFNLGPSTSPRAHVKQVEKKPRDSQARGVSPSPSSLAQAGPSKDALYQQILRQQGQLQSLHGQLEALEREMSTLEQTPPPTLSNDLLEEMNHLQQFFRRNETELAHAQYWENEFQSEVQREKDILRKKDELHLSLDKHSQRLHDTDSHCELLERDIQLLIETKRNGMLQARPSVEESVLIAKEQLDSHQRQGAELQASIEETEKVLMLVDEQLQRFWSMYSTDTLLSHEATGEEL